jgi:BASS family bile acid:Na+ symporter
MSPVVSVFLPLALAFIVFTLGLGLVPDDFRRVFQQSRAVLVGLLCQIVLLPLVAFAIAQLLGLSPAMAVGLVILGACPGGVTAGLLTNLARGNTALSITLTAVSSVATLVTLPLVVHGALVWFMGQGSDVELPLFETVRRLFLLTTLPVALGMLLRGYFPQVVQGLLPWCSRLANLFFAVIVVGTFASQWQPMMANLQSVGPAAMLLNVSMMGLAWWVAQQSRVDRRGRIAIAMECGLQNGALGIFVASVLLNNPVLAIPSVVYALFMNVSALLFLLRARRGPAG